MSGLKIFVIILALSVNAFGADSFGGKDTRSMIGGFANFDGYKNIKFGMDTNTVHSLITKAANTTKHEICAEFLDTLVLTENSEALKYYDVQYKLVYIFFFECSELYRIDIATYSGAYLYKLDIENPVSMSSIENIITSLNVEYGRFGHHSQERKGYNGKDFVRDTYMWKSSISSISLVVNPTISTFDKEYKNYIYRLTYYNDSLAQKLRSSAN